MFKKLDNIVDSFFNKIDVFTKKIKQKENKNARIK